MDMTESNPIAEDLKFVREAVEARDRPRRGSDAHLIIWTLYCVLCIPMYDFLPQWGGRINLVGWLTAMVVSGVLGRRETMRSGQVDLRMVRRTMLHWYGGVVLLVVATMGMAMVNPGMRELACGQLSIILVGFLYYTAGVHFPETRFMLWAGPVIVLGAIGIGLLHHYRWTAMGLIFAVCLMAPVAARRILHRES
jgi:hypothetical protein